MITADYVRFMARYNRWQNGNLIGAADTLSDADRRLDRGAFFHSIAETFSHLLWGDWIWIARFDGGDGPTCALSDSFQMADDWDQFKADRAAMDQRIANWAAIARDADCAGTMEWRSMALNRDFSAPRDVCLMQIFNHQTHHRGQIHAMLTAAGARPGDTDIPFMPEDV